jgi:hypothetical protein
MMIFFSKRKKRRDSMASLRAKLDAVVMQTAFYRAQLAEVKVANKSLVREARLALTRIGMLEENLNEAIRRIENV